jgi:hypothetical protein
LRVLQFPICVLAITLLLLGCASTVDLEEDREKDRDGEVYRRAESEHVDALELEVQRLRADLARAEEALIAAESGLRGSFGRADAVSSLAEAQIRVASAAVQAPWRIDEIAQARNKLEDAQRQIEEGSFGAALFFVYRARRIADQVELEGQMVSKRPGTRFVVAERVNLRSGPALSYPVVQKLRRGTPVFPERRKNVWVLVRAMPGSVGWIHANLLDDTLEPAPPAAASAAASE